MREFEKCFRVSNSLKFYPNFQYHNSHHQNIEPLIFIFENFSSSYFYKCQILSHSIPLSYSIALTWLFVSIMLQHGCAQILRVKKTIQLSWLMSVNNMKLNFHWNISIYGSQFELIWTPFGCQLRLPIGEPSYPYLRLQQSGL